MAGMRKLAGICGIAALCLPPVLAALLGLLLLDRERRRDGRDGERAPPQPRRDDVFRGQRGADQAEQIRGSLGHRRWQPFCLKLESFLREADIPFDVEPFNFRRSFRRAPKGKLPFIEDTDGTLIGDSSLIIALLSQRHGIDLDAPLTPQQAATAHACRRMLDEHLYWVMVYSRWLDAAGWPVVRETFFSRMPALLQPIVTAMARRGVTKALQAQGIGRHSAETIYTLGRQDVEALSRLLGDDSYFFAADRPTLLDLWAHAFVAEIIAPPIPSPLQSATIALGNLVAHCQRLQTRLYGRPIAAAG